MIRTVQTCQNSDGPLIVLQVEFLNTVQYVIILTPPLTKHCLVLGLAPAAQGPVLKSCLCLT